MTRSLSRSPSRVRGRCSPGVSTRISWASGAVHDAAHHGAGGLRLVGGDHDLLADQRVGQRGLAGVGPARRTTRSRCGSVARSVGHVSPRAASYAAQISSSDLPGRLARAPDRARGRPPGAGAPATAAPVAHHVVRRARQAPLAHQVLADRPHLGGLPRHPEVARRPSGQSMPSTTSASRRLAPRPGGVSQVTSAPSGR